ncbi:hypothetical protein DB032_22785 [Chromobacterium sp. Panama]|nr:hypothetical protein DB032_22785 [Chromobacterium sp. Panama]
MSGSWEGPPADAEKRSEESEAGGEAGGGGTGRAGRFGCVVPIMLRARKRAEATGVSGVVGPVYDILSFESATRMMI